MTIGTITTRRQRNEGRWLLAGLLMATTAMVAVPEAKAQDAGMTAWPMGIVSVNGEGTMFAANHDFMAYIGSADGSQRRLPTLGGTEMVAYGINRAGNVVVGQGQNADNRARAFRYVGDTVSGTTTDLGTLAPTIANSYSYGRGVSDDGTRVVGHSTWQGNRQSFVWIEGATGGVTGNEQMYGLDGLAGGYDHTYAWAISGDGRYAVGKSDGDGFTDIATRWDLGGLTTTGTATVENLGSLTGMSGNSFARAVSGDGRVVVGTSDDADGRIRAFRWREGATDGVASNVQMLDLGTLGGQYASAEAVSRDGRWVVGITQDEADIDLGFRWSEETGMESITAWLSRYGVNTTGYRLEQANGISDDGTVVVGQMQDENGDWFGYLARGKYEGPTGGGENPEEPTGGGSGLMNIAEYQQTLYAGAGGIASAGEFLSWLPMNGAHHRPLMLTPELDGDMCAWATGDFAYHGGNSTGLGLAEVGACTDLAGGAVRIGGAVGTTRSWQDLALGGSSRMAGQYVLGEVDWQPDGTPLLLSVTGMLGGWQANVDRAYSNGADTAISSGQTNAMGGVVRLRADWLDAATLGNTTINPWTSVSVGALHVDGYTESGGPFPARFNAQDLSHVDVRLGLTAITEITTQTKLSTTFEVAHRTGSAPTASGQVDGLFAFSLGGGQQSNTWLRVGAELDHKINESLSLSGSVHFATAGRDPSVAGSIGLKGAF
ncbi:autotransporter domain-containing protein [Devosia sediminis]|uniref:Autotransporter domain-containing protein n=1 Tax=Devosia sediminis TaxID=2798801 RepID=A0A934IWI0_9HYPH|nr:autotransporter domain-containing protein [Devosia sediminis]MBJ3783500.1 autotransporter domain-containing protein [Devosia sediminis]